jgi:hypothetical protein
MTGDDQPPPHHDTDGVTTEPITILKFVVLIWLLLLAGSVANTDAVYDHAHSGQ